MLEAVRAVGVVVAIRMVGGAVRVLGAVRAVVVVGVVGVEEVEGVEGMEGMGSGHALATFEYSLNRYKTSKSAGSGMSRGSGGGNPNGGRGGEDAGGGEDRLK